jgi:uncharacterized membrane protein
VLYGIEDWTIKARDARRITTLEMKDMIKTAGNNQTGHKTYTEIEKEVNITAVMNTIWEYWGNINRMPRNGLPRIQKLHTNRQETRGDISRDF